MALGEAQPGVSTLNSSTGAITANAAIVSAGSGGDVSIFVSNSADVILDVNGYFAPAAGGGLSHYTVAPCRVLDNAQRRGSVHRSAGSSGARQRLRTTGYRSGLCVERHRGAQRLAELSDAVGQWSGTTFRLNPDVIDGAITSKMAIVTTTNGTLNAFSTSSTQLIFDLSSYFAP